MSSVGVMGNGGHSPHAIFQQNLFNQIDSSGSGSITKSGLEQAVTSAGGSTQGADALFAQLDPNNTGSVNEQQFSQNLPAPHFGHQMGAQMIGFQASGWPGSSGTGGDLAQSLFSQINTNGDGSISKSELEHAVTSVGGTAQAADALYAKLDPNNTGSVSEQQLAQYLQPPSPTGNTAQDALLALIESEQAASATGAVSGNTAQDALSALIQKFASSTNCSTAGNSLQGNSTEISIWSLMESFSSTQTGNCGCGSDPLMSMLSGSTNGGSGLDPLLSMLSGSTGGGSGFSPLLSMLSGSSGGGSGFDPLMSMLSGSTGGGSGFDPLMSLLSGSAGGGASGLGMSGNTSALFASMQASSTSLSVRNSNSSVAGTANRTNLAFAISLYQNQMNDQMFSSMFGGAGAGL